MSDRPDWDPKLMNSADTIKKLVESMGAVILKPKSKPPAGFSAPEDKPPADDR